MEDKQNRDLLLIDGNSLINRAYFGGTDLTLKNGTPVGAVYTFFNILLRYINEIDISHFMIAFDLSAPTFRHKIFPDYKSGRHAMPDDLASQFKFLKELLSKLGLQYLSLESYEADDILGTIAKQNKEKFAHIYILSGDRDILQVVDENIIVIHPGNKGKVTFYDLAKLKEEFACSPKGFITYKSLLGDSSDAIPGVKGIGKKTAQDIIGKFSDLDEIYANLSAFNSGVQKKLINGKEDAYRAQTLVTINCDVPISYELENFRLSEDKCPDWQNVLREIHFLSIIKKMQVFFPKPERNSDSNDSKVKNAKAGRTYEKLNDIDFYKWITDFSDDLLIKRQDEEIFVADFAKQTYAVWPIKYLDEIVAIAQLKQFKIIVFSWKEVIHGKNFANYLSLSSEIILDLSIVAYALGDAQKVSSIQDLAEVYDYHYDDLNLNGYFDLLHDLAEVVRPKIIEQKITDLINNIDLPLVAVIESMEQIGIAVDKESLQEQIQAYEKYLDELTEEIYALVGHEFNINSPKQLGEILFNELNLPPGKKLKSGYSTSVEELNKLRNYHPIIPLILEYRMNSKLLSTYILGLIKYIGEDGRIKTTFHQTLTQTGRLSSSEPNLQNIPIRTTEGRKIRKAFVAAPNKVFIDADYSQIELRLLAHLSQDEAMLTAFKENMDIHAMTAGKIFGIPAGEVDKNQRNIGKTINFSIVYGISEFGLAQDLHISIAEAKKYIKDYYLTYPNVKKYMQDLISFAKEHGYVETLFKRRRYIPELKSGNYNIRQFGERVAMNTPVQGTAADLIRLAMVNFFAKIRQKFPQADLILQIHDELIVEAPVTQAKQIAELLQEEMRKAADLDVDLVTDVQIGENWLEAKN